MTPKIKHLSSPDVSDLLNYVPEDPEVFGLLLQVMVGPKDAIGEENFDITLCTPKWLIQKYKQSDTLFLRHHLIVFEYKYDRIVSVLGSRIETLSADNWNDLAQKIARIGHWEFEDYRP